MGSVSNASKDKNLALLENGTRLAEHWSTCLACHVTHDDDAFYCETAEKIFAERRWIEWEPKITKVQ